MKCRNCKYYEERTSFCRLNPPTPVVIFEQSKYNTNEIETKIKSMFPTIYKPDIDFCWTYEDK